MKKRIILIMLCALTICSFATKRKACVYTQNEPKYVIHLANATQSIASINTTSQQNESTDVGISEQEADLCYVAYLMKTGQFNNDYRSEVYTLYGESNLRDYVNNKSDSDLRKLSANHSKSVYKFKK